ncbi:MAG: ribose 5-phosphate isomerase B [Alphaproteobacteria bacterium]|nr:ribose 5-phosphate isomerase B [Alphaproteobacteria bacterium]
MTIAIAADHGGFELKEKLIAYYAAKGINLLDLGTHSSDSCDYPDMAGRMCEKIKSGDVETGILICGTGIGISIAANRYKGIRAAVLYSDDVAALVRQHNNANIAVLGGRTMSFEEAARRMDIFLNTGFEGGRHERRIGKLDNLGDC